MMCVMSCERRHCDCDTLRKNVFINTQFPHLLQQPKRYACVAHRIRRRINACDITTTTLSRLAATKLAALCAPVRRRHFGQHSPTGISIYFRMSPMCSRLRLSARSVRSVCVFFISLDHVMLDDATRRYLIHTSYISSRVVCPSVCEPFVLSSAKSS